jgi:hypothetical protein
MIWVCIIFEDYISVTFHLCQNWYIIISQNLYGSDPVCSVNYGRQVVRDIAVPYLRMYKPHLDFSDKNLEIIAHINRTRFYLCESKVFATAFAALWLSLAAFTVICQ